MPVTSHLVRFGVFELDLGSGELSRNGRKLKLQEQPFRLLRLLLENRGQTVTRERLKEALWPADTFVDFDHSLNAAVAKLRQALGDSAENPRFIETMARRGYRFIAPVEFLNGSNGLATELLPRNGSAPPPAAIVHSRRNNRLLILLGSAAVLFGIGLWLWPKRQPVSTELVKLTEDTGLTTDPAISPDGKLLAYASDRGSTGNLNIWIQQLGSGGNPVQLTHDSVTSSEPAFSPDGSRIAFRSNRDGGGIYTVPIIGGEATRITHAGRGPRFSPDGRWIAYSSSARDSFMNASAALYSAPGAVYIVPASGGEPRRVGTDLPVASDPVWSPDSKRLLVYRPPKTGFAWDEADWWLVSLDGSPSRPTGVFDELKRQGFSLGFDRVPRLSQWAENFITFSAAFGDTVNAWRAPISADGHFSGSTERLTQGTALELRPTATKNGDVFFATLNRTFAIWSLPADTNQGKITGEPQRLTDNAGAILPSISADGRILAFTAVRSRTHPTNLPVMFTEDAAELQVVIKNLLTGKETVLPTTDTAQWGPRLSRDGSMVAYTSSKPGRVFAAALNGSEPKLVDGGGNLYTWDWSRDNRRLLFDKVGAQVYIADVAAGHEKLFLSRTGFGLFQAKFSPDDRDIALIGCQPGGPGASQCQIFVVRFENGIPSPPENWITIDHPSQWDDKPRWSPNGELIYFISDRDGYLCLWAQRLDRRTRRPIGGPFSAYHFHNARLAMGNVDTGVLEIGITTNQIVVGLAEVTGNIWGLRTTSRSP